MAPVDLFCFVLFCHLVLILSAGYGNGHQGCPHSFTCGKLGTFYYPFTKAEQPHCGLLEIHGCDDPLSPTKTIQLEKNGKKVELNGMIQPNDISILDNNFQKNLQEDTCGTLKNYSLPPPSPFYSIYIKYNVTLFRCKHELNMKPPEYYFNHSCLGHDYDIYYDSRPTHNTEEANRLFSSCSVIQLPSKDKSDTTDLLSFLSAEMVLEVLLSDDCDQCYNRRGGRCRIDNNQKFYCEKGKTGKKMLVVATASALVVAGAVVLLMVLACCFRTKISPTTLLLWRKNPTHQIIEDFLKEHGPRSITRHNYSEIKKMTKSFTNKLGQGGFGSVYEGKLHDGRVVAVKILSESKGNGEEFINEVASISRTSHVNIVRLLGFCLDTSKRALIYEFMPNGSLDKYIYAEKSPLQVARQLDYKILYDIAIGIARGLEYLHRGCNTRILHFDIKPPNILLGEDFCPKISDFGLAKLCSKKESAVSIFGARGTAGYIAPEVFSRNFGAVSHKSDVYSYGMMVLEMVGMRNNMRADVNRSSEIYFPHWVYDRLESDQELGLQNIKNESDDKMVRKMTIVGLWCIQTYPSTRPAISKVVEMLESKVELLQIPPKPFSFSPSTSPVHLSCDTL